MQPPMPPSVQPQASASPPLGAMPPQATPVAPTLSPEEDTDARALQACHAAAFVTAPVGMCFAKLDGTILDANPHLCEMLGYTKAELLHLRITDINLPDNHDATLGVLESFRRGVATHFTTEKLYVRKDGSRFWIALTATPILDAEGRPCASLALTQDITRRKTAEHKLVESEGRFRTLFEQSPFSVQLIAKDGRVLKVNKSWVDLWQADQETVEQYILGEYNVFSDFQAAELGLHAYFWNALAGKPAVTPPIYYDPAIMGKSGRPRWAVGFIHPIRNELGEVVEVMLIHHDVTDQMQVQKELKAAKDSAETASRLKSAFLANMSHEIRTPLGAILGFADLLRDSFPAHSEGRRYLDTIMRNSMTLHRLIDDILDLSNLEAGNFPLALAPFVIDGIVAEVVATLHGEASKKGLLLRYEPYPESLTVYSDALRLKQILINLVGNAIKFTQRGSVTITVTVVQDSPDAKPRTNKRTVAIEICDTGLGIDPLHRTLLFKPFSQVDSSDTRSFAGSGLGLALSRQLAIALGGDVVLAESQLGAGSLFVISLPLSTASPRPKLGHAITAKSQAEEPSVPRPRQATALAKPSTLKPHSSSGRALRALLADDAEDNRVVMSRMLEKQGYVVTTAVDGLDAVEKAKKDAYDLILMDMQMPELDGFAATRQIRALGFTQAIIAVTAHTKKEDCQRCLDAGCSAFLAKPIAFKQLRELLASFIPKP